MGKGNLMRYRLFVMFFITVTLCFLGVARIYASEPDADFNIGDNYQLADFQWKEVNIDLGVSYRTDSLNWNIAGDLNGQNPNILSELSWKDLQILLYTIKLKCDLNECFFYQSSLDYGKIHSGNVQDSDYNGDNRTLEFSRSNDKSNGADVLDLSVAFGYKLETAADYEVDTLVGYSDHKQNLSLTDGYQTIPPNGPFDGLDSSYRADWSSLWFGLNMKRELGSNLTLFGNIEYHWANYLGEGDWNLRSDFDHPESFSHQASATGTILTAGLEYAASKQWFVGLGLGWSSWSTNPGIDTVYLTDGTTVSTRLNVANWESITCTLKARYMF